MIGVLHTEITKDAKTDLNLGPWTRSHSVPLRSLRSLCESSFMIGVLHTEITKDAKTDLNFGTLDP
jgi:hypothetical protein